MDIRWKNNLNSGFCKTVDKSGMTVADERFISSFREAYRMECCGLAEMEVKMVFFRDLAEALRNR